MTDLPVQLQLERRLVGLALHAPEIVADGAAPLRLSDFMGIQERAAWKAIGSLVQRGEAIDAWTVANEMGNPDAEASLALCIEPTASIDQVPTLVRTLVERSSRAESAQAIQDLQAGNVADALRRLQAADERLGATRDGWTPARFTLEDAVLPRAERPQVVPGLFARPSLSSIFGPPGTLKTQLAVNLAGHVAGGTGWLPAPVGKPDVSFPTVQGPVLFLDFDNGRDAMLEAIEAMSRGIELDPGGLLTCYSMPSPMLNAGELKSVRHFANVIQEEGARLVVIDNLGLISGGADMNSPAMIPVMGNLRWLAEETQAAILLIHHQRKTPGHTSRSGEALMGHTSIEASLNLALKIEREDGDPVARVTATKVRGAPVRPFGVTFAYEHKPGTTSLHAANFLGLQIQDPRTTKMDALKLSVCAFLEKNPRQSKSAVAAAIGGNRSLALEAIRQLMTDDQHKVTGVNGPRGAFLLELA
jgi:hypothetical protein